MQANLDFTSGSTSQLPVFGLIPYNGRVANSKEIEFAGPGDDVQG